jgi:hypothetical protein
MSKPHSFLTSVLDGDECITSRPGRFTHGNELRYPQTRTLGESTDGLEILEKLKISTLM